MLELSLHYIGNYYIYLSTKSEMQSLGPNKIICSRIYFMALK